MNLKRFIAAMSACAAVSAAAMSVNVNAVELSAYAYLCGDMGTAEVKELSDIPAGSKTAIINGDGQYEVVWKVAEGTVNNSKQHHQCTGDNAGNLILGKNIFVLQIRGLIGADTIASHLQKQLCSSVA